MTMLITYVCTSCSKVNIAVVNSAMIKHKSFYALGWNVLYSGTDGKSQGICVCSEDCMQVHVNHTKRGNVWVEPDGSEKAISPAQIH